MYGLSMYTLSLVFTASVHIATSVREALLRSTIFFRGGVLHIGAPYIYDWVQFKVRVLV